MNSVEVNEVILDIIHTKSEEVGNIKASGNLNNAKDILNCLVQEIVIIENFQKRANKIGVGYALKELLVKGYKPIVHLLSSRLQKLLKGLFS